MKAVINGLAPDKGLYFPQEKVILSKEFIESIKNIDDVEICFEVINKYIGDEIPKQKLIEIIENTISDVYGNSKSVKCQLIIVVFKF